jgi:hypothetical protein
MGRSILGLGMFFLVPRVALILLLVFGAMVGLRMWRGRRGRLASRDVPLVPAALLRGADRTWVVFTSPDCDDCRAAAARLRQAEPVAHIAEVDARREPLLANAYRVRRLPTILLANRYGEVEARLVGLRALSDRIGPHRRRPA